MPTQLVPMTEVLAYLKAYRLKPKSHYDALGMYRAIWKAKGGRVRAKAVNIPKQPRLFNHSQVTHRHQVARRNLIFEEVELWLPPDPNVQTLNKLRATLGLP